LLLPQALAEVTALVSKADEFTDEVELKPFESVVQERYSAERGWLRKRLEECLATGSLDIMTECGPRFPQPVQDAVLAIGLAVANADGVIEQVEFEALRRVAVLLDKNPDVAIGNWEAFNTAQKQAAWWNTLNVPPTISLEGLSKAYRDLARKCHPDRWHNADEGQRTAAAQQMKAINDAYAKARADLSDPRFKNRMAARAATERRKADEARREECRKAAGRFETIATTARETLENMPVCVDSAGSVRPSSKDVDQPARPDQSVTATTKLRASNAIEVASVSDPCSREQEKEIGAKQRESAKSAAEEPLHFELAAILVVLLVVFILMVASNRKPSTPVASNTATQNAIATTPSEATDFTGRETRMSELATGAREVPTTSVVTGQDLDAPVQATDAIDSKLAQRPANALQEDKLLAVPVPFFTSDMKRINAVNRIIEMMPFPVELETGPKNILVHADDVSDELRGISIATALAILLRPAGLAWEHDLQSGNGSIFKLVLANSAGWPIGHSSRDAGSELVTRLAVRLPLVEIDENPLPAVMKAFRSRLHVPVLIDHSSIAERARVDRQFSTIISYKANDLNYDQALEGLLGIVGLNYEARVDDGGAAFIWVSAPYYEGQAQSSSR
jgi:hypothetical protein